MNLPIRFSAIRTLWLAAALASLASGCEPSTESKLNQPIDAPPPRHPAMVDGAATGAATPAPRTGALPEGHPPIAPQQGGGTPAASSGTASSGGRVAIGPISFAVPEGWIQEAPSSAMRLGQFRLPRAEGDSEDGLMTLISAGGSVADNIHRWEGQFQESPTAQTSVREVGGLKITMVKIDGTYAGMGGPAAGGGGPQKGFRLLGAVVEIPAGLLFLKGTGPEKTMGRWEKPFEGMIDSMKVAGK